MTGFGDISPLWHNFTSLGQFLVGLFNIWQNVNLTLAKAIGQVFIVVDSHILKNNLAIWSHCLGALFSDQLRYAWTSLEDGDVGLNRPKL